jgi:hypothetical protein
LQEWAFRVLLAAHLLFAAYKMVLNGQDFVFKYADNQTVDIGAATAAFIHFLVAVSDIFVLIGMYKRRPSFFVPALRFYVSSPLRSSNR